MTHVNLLTSVGHKSPLEDSMRKKKKRKRITRRKSNGTERVYETRTDKSFTNRAGSSAVC
jgi:hypothetical protein